MLKTQIYRLVIIIITIIIITSVTFLIWISYFSVTPADPNNSIKKVLEIPRGISRQRVTNLLVENHIIKDSKRFMLLGILLQKWAKIKAGDYEFSSSQTPLEVFRTLESGVSVGRLITFPEGSNIYQIAETLDQEFNGKGQEFLSLTKDLSFIKSLGFESPAPKTLEGYLHPDTYRIERSLSPKDLITIMREKQKKIWSENFSQRAQELRFSKHEILTLASIIEKETGAPFERKTISGVFHNRLKKGMRLQSDPTTIYGMWHRYQGNIRRKDLREHTPYNTYTINRLPVGPIANPGFASIEAALYPEETDYLYFVSNNDGTHVFSKTLKEHNNAVRKTQLDPAAREGKSWRDLQKNQKN